MLSTYYYLLTFLGAKSVLKTIVLSSIAVLSACLLDSALKVISVTDFCWDDILLYKLSLGIWTGFLDCGYRVVEVAIIMKWLLLFEADYFCVTSSLPYADIVDPPTASYFFLWERAAAFAALNLVHCWVRAMPSILWPPNFAAVCRTPLLLTDTAVLLLELRPPSICLGALDAVELQAAAEFSALKWCWLKLLFGVFREQTVALAWIFATLYNCGFTALLLLLWELSSTRSIGCLLKFEVCFSGKYKAAERPTLLAVYCWAVN